jgi:ATP-binding cassette subfamily C protein CydD
MNETLTTRSERARQVARWFGLHPRDLHLHLPARVNPRLLLPARGEIILLSGPSGSGKSTLLRAIRSSAPDRLVWIDLDALELPDLPLIDCLADVPVSDALRELARVGLAEPRATLRSPRHLSAGEQWRFRLALSLHQARRHPDAAICCDEFAATLDRITARVVARALRRAISEGLRALVATSHDDLCAALEPDRLVECDFGSVQLR